ncbi:hypothetical protein V5735_21115 (plasmid) [Haladaptatus sp. SPP-AMP-3]|uniref:hypothetical protein n=1 Tax=Haladaptatus sp. SPP-AMP-3 TaxID=3121295 RepID=UPI003C301F34
MRRRQFVLASGIGAVAALSGCLGSDSSPPPRKSSVITNFEMQSGSLVIDLVDDPWLMSRYDGNQGSAGMLSPVGIASAKGKNGGGGGRGATGRGSGSYSSAPRTGHGYAWYHGGGYADDWYDDHDDDVTRYQVAIATLGIAYLGSTAQMQDDAPDAGAVPWDKTFRNPSGTVEYDVSGRSGISQDGWYRVGANVMDADGNHNFRWECFDLEIDSGIGDGFNIDEEWKVSPRI